MEYCENFRGIVVSEQQKTLLVGRMRCKQWSCDYCSQKNRQIWRAHLLDYAVKNPALWSFLTITATGGAHRRHVSLENITENFDKLMKRLKRAWGNFEYVRVYERHQSGEFHAHLLITVMPSDAYDKKAYRHDKKRGKSVYRGTHYKTLKMACFECGMGFMVDYTPLVDLTQNTAFLPHHAVGYVTKYLTKSIGGEMPKGTRRIQTSRAISTPKDEPVNTWRIKSGIYLDDVMKYETVIDLSTGYTVTSDDFLDGKHIYPSDLT